MSKFHILDIWIFVDMLILYVFGYLICVDLLI